MSQWDSNISAVSLFEFQLPSEWYLRRMFNDLCLIIWCVKCMYVLIEFFYFNKDATGFSVNSSSHARRCFIGILSILASFPFLIFSFVLLFYDHFFASKINFLSLIFSFSVQRARNLLTKGKHGELIFYYTYFFIFPPT